MASAADKSELIRLARKGKFEGDDGFRAKLADLERGGIKGPGHDYGLDFSKKPYYRTALWEATWKNHEAIVKLLVEKGATIDFKDYQGRTPLHEAAFYGYRNLVEYFLDKGHPIDPLDNFGQSPLFRAAEAGRDEIVELLVNRKAETNLVDKDATTAQHIASFHGRPNMSEWLLFNGAWKNRFATKDLGIPEHAGSKEAVAEGDQSEAVVAAS
jgi:ankyrin repeat protein